MRGCTKEGQSSRKCFVSSILSSVGHTGFNLKPRTQSTIFISGNKDLDFCRQRRKPISSMFDLEDRRQRQKSLICVSSTQQVFVASDKSSSSRTKIFLMLNILPSYKRDDRLHGFADHKSPRLEGCFNGESRFLHLLDQS